VFGLKKNKETLSQLARCQAQMNAHLFGCSWAGATLSSVSSSFSKMDKGEAKENLRKKGGVKIAKWTIRVRRLVTTDRFPFPTLHGFNTPLVFFTHSTPVFLQIPKT